MTTLAVTSNPWVRLMRIDRPIGSLLLLWPTLWALWLAAEGLPHVANLVVFVAGVVVMRAAGCVINDIADRNFDGHVKRTARRPLATGEVTLRGALVLFFSLLVLALLLVLTRNALTIQLAFAAVALAALYPFMKRVTHLPQVVLGMAFGWGIPMAFAAETSSVPAVGWWLFAGNLTWTVAYDTLYAMVDRDDDERIGIRSTARLFGRGDRLAVGVLQILSLMCWGWVGIVANLGWPYWLALAGCCGLFIQQQWQVRDRDRDACFAAFLANNRVGALLFAGIVASYVCG